MKVLNIILVLSFLYSCYNRACSGLASKASQCNEDSIFDTKKYHRCCFVEAEAEKDSSEFRIKLCYPVEKSVYNNITALLNEATKNVRKIYDIDVKVKVDCNCYYINISILLLALLLL